MMRVAASRGIMAFDRCLFASARRKRVISSVFGQCRSVRCMKHAQKIGPVLFDARDIRREIFDWTDLLGIFLRRYRSRDRYFERVRGGAFRSALHHSLFPDQISAPQLRELIHNPTHSSVAMVESPTEKNPLIARPSVRRFKINSNLGSDRL